LPEMKHKIPPQGTNIFVPDILISGGRVYIVSSRIFIWLGEPAGSIHLPVWVVARAPIFFAPLRPHGMKEGGAAAIKVGDAAAVIDERGLYRINIYTRRGFVKDPFRPYKVFHMEPFARREKILDTSGILFSAPHILSLSSCDITPSVRELLQALRNSFIL